MFRFRDNDEPQPTEENRRLEITWTVATAIILVFVGVASYGVLADEAVTYTPDAEVEGEVVIVEAEAYQWGWEMTYPEEGQITTDGEVVIPADRPVRFDITSRDVIHGFAVPELGLKQDAFPQQVNSLQTVAYEEGTYQGYATVSAIAVAPVTVVPSTVSVVNPVSNSSSRAARVSSPSSNSPSSSTSASRSICSWAD